MSPDPAGNFASDLHRRVLANCSGRTFADVAKAVYADVNTRIDQTPDHGELSKVLEDLRGEGLLDGGFELLQFTDEGLALLVAPSQYEPPPMAAEHAAAEIQRFVEAEREMLSSEHGRIVAQIQQDAKAAADAAAENVASYSAVLDDLLKEHS